MSNYSKSYIELHIAKLETNPVENSNLIRKWKRLLRKIDKEG